MQYKQKYAEENSFPHSSVCTYTANITKKRFLSPLIFLLSSPNLLLCSLCSNVPCGFLFVIILVNFLFMNPLPGLPQSCLSQFNLAQSRLTTNIKLNLYMLFTNHSCCWLRYCCKRQKLRLNESDRQSGLLGNHSFGSLIFYSTTCCNLPRSYDQNTCS